MLRSFPAWRRVVTVLCLAGVLSPAAIGMAANPEDKLDAVEQRLEKARKGLRGVERRKKVELADLQRVDARRAELDSELAGLNEQLDEAETQLADSSAALHSTTQKLVETEGRLEDTRKELTSTQKQFNARARSTYMYGGQAGWTGLILGVESISKFERGLKYARSIMQDDRRQVERMTALEATIQRTTADLAVLQKRRAAQRAVDADRRDAAAAVLAKREEVARQVAAEAHKRRLLVDQLESDRRSYVAMVADLESEGRQLEQELQRIAAAEQARREAAARAAAEAAAQRRAAAADRKAPSPAVAPPPARTGAMQWPANGPKTSNYGWRTHPIFGTRRFHAGIDIGAGYGAAIVAAQSGVVVSAGSRGGYGNTVVIDHGGGLATLYAHQSSMAVSAGQSVSRGQVIGAVGSTGYSTGPHLHFEVRVNGATRDPMGYF